MEKRRSRPLAGAIGFSSGGAQTALIVILFLSGYLTMRFTGLQPTPPAKGEVVNQVRQIKNEKTKELVRIKAIVKSHRPEIGETEAWKVSKAVHEESVKRNFDPLLILAIIKVESGFRNNAVSPVGARGIMQIMPATGKFLSEKILGWNEAGTQEFSPDYLHDPAVNIRLGVYYLNGLKKRFQSLSLALLAYNFGPSRMQRRLDNETSFPVDYAAAVLDAYREYRKAKNTAS